jgi:autotransporter strand-loop-strand O-heptosyltransferase
MRAFITHTTSNYENITLNLVKSIKKYSKYDIIVYTIDYDGTDKLQKEVKCIRIDLNIPSLNDDSFINNINGNFYVDREKIRSYYALGAKVDAMLHASQFIDEWVYLDSDSIANKNVDDLFEYCSKATEFPLATLGPHQYVLLVKNGEVIGNPFWKNDGSIDYENTLEYPLMSFMGVPKNQRGSYRTTNILVGNNTVSNFISLWKDIKNLLPQICQLTKITPFHEETIYNVLTWKINPNHNGLPMSYINVENSSIVDHFLSTEVKENTLISEFYRIPKNKKEIKVFHGEKRQDEIDKMFQIIDDYDKDKPLKVLFLAPHLSTGGMPSYLLKRIESLIKYTLDIEIFVAEFCEYSNLYTVQRNRIKELIPEQRFWTINTLSNHTVENSMKVIDIIKSNSIDIVHVDEMIEGFDSFNKVPNELKNALYNNDRTWRVVETCHNVWFDPNTSKSFHPDAYAFCTPYHKEVTFKKMPSHKEVFEFPIENKFRSREDQVRCLEILGLDTSKVHVLNVGLWTSGKNQKEGLEIARYFQNDNVEFHFVGNQASNFENYWGPLMNDLPSNVRIWGERSDVETFMVASDILMFNSTWECNPLVIREAASFGLKIMARDLPQYVGMFDGLIYPLVDDITSNVSSLKKLISSSRNYRVLDGMTHEFAEKHYQLYKFLLTQKPTKKIDEKSNVVIKRFFINEPFLEILGDSESEFEVKFFDEVGVCHYNHKIKSNHWIRLNRKYFTKWNTKIYENGVVIYDETLNYSGKRVFINFDSKSLGDTVSWIPYVLEFKKTHNCDVVVSTYWNHLFKEVYPELEFVQPGTVVHNIFGQYNLGWFWDISKEPELPNTIPLQKAATNILGLPYSEIKPKIHYKIGERPYSEKYVTIATNSTAGCKFWTKEGWQELINHLNSLGYKVVNVSKEINPFDNCERLDDTSIENTMNVIHHSEFFIGLSSGLSWLSWAIGKHVVMISNFTEADHEFTTNCTRITNPNVCNSCWNNPNFKFDKGDWNWCPVHKGTSQQFECHTSITSEMVINKIQTLLK